jgi:hypothetical protein
MFNMGSHDPFGHLEHKLWPKEGLEVELAIWLPTTKSLESPRFPCVKVACHITLESSWWGLYLCFKPHLKQRFVHKVMGPQSCMSPNFWEFLDSHLGVPRQNEIWVLVPWPRTEYTIRGKVVASPKFGPWWVLWVCVCPWFLHAPKCSNYALTNLLFGLCRSVWVIELLVNLLNPILELQHTPLPPKCYKLRNVPQLFFLSLSSSRSLGVRHLPLVCEEKK